MRNWNRTKFYIVRSDKERLLIYASIAGLIFFIISYALYIIGTLASRFFDPCPTFSICIPQWWNQFVNIPYAGIALGSFLLGITLWWPLNRFLNYRRLSQVEPSTLFDPNHWQFFENSDEIERVVLKDDDPLEILLFKAQQKKKHVIVTMDDSKVYVGKVSSISNPGRPTSNISLLPEVSGFRDPATRCVMFTTDYRDALNEAKQWKRELILQATQVMAADKVESRRLAENWEDLKDVSRQFVLVIPVARISSICFFDYKIHENFFKSQIVVSQEKFFKSQIVMSQEFDGPKMNLGRD